MNSSQRNLSLIPAAQSGPIPADLLYQLPGLIWTTDSELRLTSVSGAALPLLENGACLGQSVELLFAPRPVFAPLRAHQRALQGQSCDFIFSCGGRDMAARVSPLRSPEGVCTGTIGQAQDSTERMMGERALRISEQSYRSLIEEIPYAICRASRDGQLLQVNRAMLEMLGYDEESEAELLMRDLPDDIFLPGAFEEFQNILLHKESLQSFECVWRSRLGKEVEISLGGRVTKTGGEACCLDLLAENITQRKRTEMQLRQSQKMQSIGQLAGGIAHDFNNLLTVIAGQVELMMDAPLDGETQARLREVVFASERASSLTRQLLAFSRRQALQSRELDLNQVIGQMSQMLARLIGEHIELTFLPAPQPACIKADSSQIEQVMMNLAVNARDAMPRGGKLTIAIDFAGVEESSGVAGMEPGNYVRLNVTDTGCGMDHETQTRIFEPFFTTKPPGTGTGLGLSTVYGIVKQSNGQIAVESAPGRGAAIRIYLPEVRHKGPANSHEARPAAPRCGHETILYAEDNSAVREMICHYLRGHGYTVLSAGDGAEALELAREHKGSIDLLLSDLMMPRKGGLELAEEMREMLPGVRVVLVSGNAGTVAGEDELTRSGTVFLAKPFALQRLAETLRGLLDTAPN
jgi:PAS domain S-box-containing protein